MTRLPAVRLTRRHLDPATGDVCGRSRRDHLAERRQHRREKVAGAAALAALAVVAVRYQDVRVAVGALLGFVLASAALWRLAVCALRGWDRLGWHADRATRRAEVPEPPSNLLYATTRDDRRPDESA